MPPSQYPKILRVIFDNLLTFSKHVEGVAARVKGRNKILKAITDSTCRKDKETLLDTYKAIAHTLIDYAAPVWAPSISDTQITRLQTVQNQALRIVTGGHTMTAESHLHDECKILTMRGHCSLFTRQHLIKYNTPAKSCQDEVLMPYAPIGIKETK